MPRTITVTCPDCEKQAKAPSDLVGKKIRCKACGAAFTVRDDDEVEEVDEVEEAPKKKPAAKKPVPKKPEPKKEAPAAKKASASDDEDAKGYGLTHIEEGHRCPHCANEMLDETAIICVYCGYNTMTREKSSTKKTIEHTGGDYFWWLLPGILSAIGAILLISWIIIHWTVLEEWLGGEANKDAWYMFITHLSMKLWFTVPELFLLYSAIAFAVRRLILNNVPPEIEKKV